MMCDRYSCKMSEMACYVRRKNALTLSPANYNKPGSHDLGCRDCEQGAAIAAKINPDEAKAYSDDLRTVMARGASAVANKKRGRPKKQTQTTDKRGDMKTTIHPEPPKVRPVGPPPPPISKHSFPSLPTPTDQKTDNHAWIILDMSDYPQLLNSLQVEALKQFRTLENQILYLLHSRACNMGVIVPREADNAEQD